LKGPKSGRNNGYQSTLSNR